MRGWEKPTPAFSIQLVDKRVTPALVEQTFRQISLRDQPKATELWIAIQLAGCLSPDLRRSGLPGPSSNPEQQRSPHCCTQLRRCAPLLPEHALVEIAQFPNEGRELGFGLCSLEEEGKDRFLESSGFSVLKMRSAKALRIVRLGYKPITVLEDQNDRIRFTHFS